MRKKTSPISVILVSSGSRGNKLLFRYPFQRVSENTSSATSPPSAYMNASPPHQHGKHGDIFKDNNRKTYSIFYN
uniref:Uncharacterized protein n=1 Tax=Sinocyclocheilus anshuiensis TaxID=1608454 RepID=A0A671QGY2_9TELE